MLGAIWTGIRAESRPARAAPARGSGPGEAAAPRAGLAGPVGRGQRPRHRRTATAAGYGASTCSDSSSDRRSVRDSAYRGPPPRGQAIRGVTAPRQSGWRGRRCRRRRPRCRGPPGEAAQAAGEGRGPRGHAAEAQALTAKAAELMAKYGIDRALLAAGSAGDRSAGQPGAGHRQSVGARQGALAVRTRVGAALPVRHAARHEPGAGSICSGTPPTSSGPMPVTSVLVQMWQGLAARRCRSWSVARGRGAGVAAGFPPPWYSRVRDRGAGGPGRKRRPRRRPAYGSRAALVLADRRQVIPRNIEAAYPLTRTPA